MEKLQQIDAMLGFGGFEYVVLLINVLIFVFSGRIVGSTYRSRDERSFNARLWVLRFINFVLVILYFFAVFFTEHARQISETGLTLLLAYLAVHFSQVFLINRYGRIKEIDGVEYRSETYQSEMFGLIIFLIASITAFLVIINIWGMTSWLQATSVLGGLLVILFSTKDVWAPDNINGLILLYNRDIEPGCVVKLDEHDLMAIVLKISLTQITQPFQGDYSLGFSPRSSLAVETCGCFEYLLRLPGGFFGPRPDFVNLDKSTFAASWSKISTSSQTAMV